MVGLIGLTGSEEATQLECECGFGGRGLIGWQHGVELFGGLKERRVGGRSLRFGPSLVGLVLSAHILEANPLVLSLFDSSQELVNQERKEI